MSLSRRGFITSLAAALATPALVRASSLDFVPSVPKILRPGFLTLDDYAERILRPQIETLVQAQADSLLYGLTSPSLQLITRESARLFKNSNAFLAHLSAQYDNEFAREGAKIDQILRIRFPSNYTVAGLPEPPA